MMSKKFIILDGNALVHRAWHALPPLATKNGELVNAVYGFLLVFFKALKDLKPDYIAATFDLKGPTFRHKEFANYKAKRVKQPDELYAQIPKIKELLTAFGVPIFEKEGFEADDLIGTIAQQVQNRQLTTDNLETVIVTGDMDTLQLVDEHTKVLALKKGISETILYDVDAVKKRFGLLPEQMIDYKAMRGDPSDNIPGVRGIGEKTATELLKEFGTIDGIERELARCVTRSLDSARDDKNATTKCKLAPKLVEKLRGAHETLEQSKRLVTIVRDVPLSRFNLDSCEWGDFDREAVVKKFQEFEFHSLVGRIPQTHNVILSEDPTAVGSKSKDLVHEPARSLDPARDDKGTACNNEKCHLINTQEQFKKFLQELKKQTAFVVDTETTGPDPFRDTLVGMSFCWKEGEAWYVDLTSEMSSRAKPRDLGRSMSETLRQAQGDGDGDWLSQLKPILENPKVEKFGHNTKYDIEIMTQSGVVLSPITFDTMVASYLLNPGSRQHNLDQVAFTAFGKELTPISSGAAQLTMDTITPERVVDHNCTHADYTFRLVEHFRKELKEKNLLNLFEKIELPLVPVLAAMEKHGITVDAEYLNELSGNVGRQLRALEKKITKLAGTTFNVNSPSQLKEVLFEKLNISSKGVGHTKTGLSTAAEELEKLKGAHPIVPLVLDYRELAKLKNTYLDALPALIHPETKRVHTSFNQTVTATGRLSSSNPNLQNIPVRTDLGNEVRNAFVAERGKTFLSLDYSQIELRVIASLANDERMIAAFNSGEDIHAATAAAVYDVPLKKVTPEQRRNAKTINFGIIYGLGSVGLAEQVGISREEARAFIDQYFAVYSGVARYIEETKALAASLGYVESLFGRRRYLPEITSGVQQVRAAAERMAVNMPVQATAADLMKLAMIQVDHELPILCPDAAILLQVHDSLLLELPPKDLEQVARRVADLMTDIYKLRVPVEVHVESGQRWGSLKPLHF